MKELQQIMQELKQSDNLTPFEILKMNMNDYHIELIERAQKVLRERHNTNNLLTIKEQVQHLRVIQA